MRDGDSDAVHRSIASCARSSAPRCSRSSSTARAHRRARDGRRARPRRAADAHAGDRRAHDRATTCARAPGASPAWHDARPGHAAARRRARVRALARRVSARVRRDPRRSRRRRRARTRSRRSRSIRPTSGARAKCRRAATCCTCAKAYLETRGRADALADLIVRSAPAFAALLRQRRAARRARRSDDRCGRAARRNGCSASPGGAITEIVELDRRPRDCRRPTPSVCSRRTSTRSSGSSSYVDGWSASVMRSRRPGDSPCAVVAGRLFAARCGRLLLGLRARSQPQSRSLDAAAAGADAPVNDFAHVIDARAPRRSIAMIRALQAATGDVVVVATVPTIEPYGDIRRVRRQAVREPRPRHRRQGQGQRPADPARAEGTARLGRGRLRPRAVDHRRLRRRDQPRGAWRRSFRNGRYGDGLRAGTERIVGRIAQGRGVTLEGVRVPRAARQRDDAPISDLAVHRGLHRAS